jgi:hypothetical protein
MNKKTDATRRDIVVKFRVSQFELTKLQSRAEQWTDGNVSDLIRWAVLNMRSRPKQAKKKDPQPVQAPQINSI